MSSGCHSVKVLSTTIGYSLVAMVTQGGHALWKTGKMMKKNSLQGKIREFEILLKVREKSGNLKNLIFVRSKYSIFIDVQMWLLVVSFCHMLEIPADLILLKGGVLVRLSTCLLYILFFLCFNLTYEYVYCKLLLHNQLISRLVPNLKILVFIPTL